MTAFDTQIIYIINQYARHSWIGDNAAYLLSNSPLLKGGVLVAAIWGLWFRNKDFYELDRKYVVSTVISGLLAIAVARALALTLPFRARPLNEVGLDFNLPYGMRSGMMESWSSFPSDHAVLFFAISTGLLFISRKIGIVALLYTTLFIGLPRIYLGLHYPTDIIFGAMMGVCIGWVGNRVFVKSAITHVIVGWADSKPAYFYALFFLVSYELVSLFDFSRSTIKLIYPVVRTVIEL